MTAVRAVRVVPAALAALLLTPAAAPAAPAPRASAAMTDPAGDFPLASHDILGVRLGTTRVAGIPAVRAVLTLAGRPDPKRHYAVVFSDGCHRWSIVMGLVQHPEPMYRHSACLEETGRPFYFGTETTGPAMAEVAGNTVVFTAYFTDTMRPGRRITVLGGYAALATGSQVNTLVREVGSDGWVGDGDRAEAPVSYVLR